MDDRARGAAGGGAGDVAGHPDQYSGRLEDLDPGRGRLSMGWIGHIIGDPIGALLGGAADAGAQLWTGAMLTIWNAGLWFFRVALTLLDAFTTPDLRFDGPASTAYGICFAIAGSLVLLLGFVQIGAAAFTRRGPALARVGIGLAQFAGVWAGWVTYLVALVVACGGLTRWLMKAMLGVTRWSQIDWFASFSTTEITDGTVATVLAVMGIVLILASIGHILVMLARAAALLVLATTTPISAAGLVSDVGRSWFWKSLRWVHAAALTPVLMILVLGLGVQISTGVAAGLSDSTQEAVATALPGVIMICVGCVSPLALFKLLAFVDPGTNSGAAIRASMAAGGGVGQMLTKLTGGNSGGSDAASQSGSDGRSQGESGADDTTQGRFAGAGGGKSGGHGGSKGGMVKGMGALGAVAGTVASVGARGAAIGVDLTNQMGVGHQTYHPDFAGTGTQKTKSDSTNGDGTRDGIRENDTGGDGPGNPDPPSPSDGQQQPTSGEHGPDDQGQGAPDPGPSTASPDVPATTPPSLPTPSPPDPPAKEPAGGGPGGQGTPGGGGKPAGPGGSGGAAGGGAAEGAVVA
ncbi:type IV secretion system protein [Leekyejoonella antrihumi]|uniref:type IV secretion system protein n=1 Tax=Leekyejoonella antrihumi TaxID=1660198 RepID=UPI00164879C1|nr:type IV secretion system protein [Leekyejoonella antrihumi]